MSSMIEARIEVNAGQVVPCIKALRTSLGLGLKEAKDLYDYLRDRGNTKVRCTDAQFSRLLLEHALSPTWLFMYHDIRRVQEEPRDYIVLGEPIV